MQIAHEELLETVMSGDGSSRKIITTRAEDAEDEARTIERAHSHTRTQLELLVRQLRKQRDSCVNKDVRESYSKALAPLEVRLNKYLEADKAERDRIARIKVVN